MTERDFVAMDRPSNNTKQEQMQKDANRSPEAEILAFLRSHDAIAAMFHTPIAHDPLANDIWPNVREPSKAALEYHMLQAPFYPRRPWNGEGSYKRTSVSSRESSATLRPTHGDIDRPLEDNRGRPQWKLPVEVIELIASNLSREDIKSLRLVSRELDERVSQVIFRTVVVPFNTEIYGMLESEDKIDIMGKKQASADHGGYLWKNPKEDEVYNGHGLDVFKGFGKHILKFGMSFEVDDNILSVQPSKELTEKKSSFWGHYQWPLESYARFDHVAGLEDTADQTCRMKVAFSELTKVKELALSLDGGLGWLKGPDLSIRARVLPEPMPVFGTKHCVPSRKVQAQLDLWQYLLMRHAGLGSDIKTAQLFTLECPQDKEFRGSLPFAKIQPDIPFMDRSLVYEAMTCRIANRQSHAAQASSAHVRSRPSSPCEEAFPVFYFGTASPNRLTDALEEKERDPDELNTESRSSTGILFTSAKLVARSSCRMIPNYLTNEQNEWLLETQWAQHAFLASYLLSIADNPKTFQSIHTLTLSRIPDSYLSILIRDDFWDALPSLKELTIMVLPSWRKLNKDKAGVVRSTRISPVTAVDLFHEFLEKQIAPHPGIQTLTVGWVCGGERAEGLFARNKLLFPAPLVRLNIDIISGYMLSLDFMLDHEVKMQNHMIEFPYVQRLRLQNCYTTPAVLVDFVTRHDDCALEELVLDSVSLMPLSREEVISGPAGADDQALANQFGGLAIPGPQPNPAPLTPDSITENFIEFEPRKRSWIGVLDLISPGLTLKDLGSNHSRADPDRKTNLLSIQFISCGYSFLPNAILHNDRDNPHAPGPTPVPTLRAKALAERATFLRYYMQWSKWALLGEITQDFDSSELQMLWEGWGLWTGWADAEEAEKPEFDGVLAGGTGRFSGTVKKGDTYLEYLQRVVKM